MKAFVGELPRTYALRNNGNFTNDYWCQVKFPCNSIRYLSLSSVGDTKKCAPAVGDRCARIEAELSQTQNLNLRANCICLDEPESPVGKRVLVITPNVVLPT
jgi:hypothetical protein